MGIALTMTVDVTQLGLEGRLDASHENAADTRNSPREKAGCRVSARHRTRDATLYRTMRRLRAAMIQVAVANGQPCEVCSRPILLGEKLHVDHRFPLAAGLKQRARELGDRSLGLQLEQGLSRPRSRLTRW